MASPSFGLPGGSTPGTSNNAPLPIPGNTNPTGTNSGVGFNTGSTFPNFPLFGAPNTGSPVGPTANAPLWSGTSGGIANLSSGLPTDATGQNLRNELNGAYGSGVGNMIYDMISKGLFNPQTAAAFLNAMGPSEARGLANVQNSFGAEGSRFGSAAALGIGDFESQVNLNEQQTLASMYMQAQQEELTLLGSVMPSLRQEHIDSSGGFAGFMKNFADFINFPAGSPSPSGASSFKDAFSGGSSSGGVTNTPNFGAPGGIGAGAGGSTVGSDFGTMGAGGGIDAFVGGSSGGAALGGATAAGGTSIGELGMLLA